MFELGIKYTRHEIHNVVGGGLQDYLPHRDGVVVCGCFSSQKNPQAPRVILVGDGPDIQRWAEVLAKQQSPIPCFLKRSSNAWEYVGSYRSLRFTQDSVEIARAARGTGRTDVSGVLLLEADGDAASALDRGMRTRPDAKGKKQAPSRQPSAKQPDDEGSAAESSPLRSAGKRSKVFISYSHVDKDWLHRLKVHLLPLERDVGIEFWDDEKLKAGMKWRTEIKRAIAEARVAVLLVSGDFLASDFVANDELPPLLSAAEREGLIVLPLIVRPCRFVQTKSLSQFQAVNSPSYTLAAMPHHESESCFVKVADRIEELLHGDESQTVLAQ